MGFQEALERVLDGFLLPLDIATEAAERHAGMIRDCAVWEDLAVQILEERAEIADRAGARAEKREALGGCGEDGFGVGGAVEQGEEIEDLPGVEARAFDAQLMDGGLGVGQPAKIDAEG